MDLSGDTIKSIFISPPTIAQLNKACNHSVSWTDNEVSTANTVADNASGREARASITSRET